MISLFLHIIERTGSGNESSIWIRNPKPEISRIQQGIQIYYQDQLKGKSIFLKISIKLCVL